MNAGEKYEQLLAGRAQLKQRLRKMENEFFNSMDIHYVMIRLEETNKEIKKFEEENPEVIV